MSGFFALPRSTLERGRNLSPRGFKIALEMMCKCRARRVREVPIHFAPRQHGQSKLTVREQFRFLEHLSRLYDFSYPRRSSYSKFVVVAALGFIMTALFMRAMLNVSIVAPAALCLAYPVAVAVTALFFLRYVTAQRAFIVPTRPWRDFLLISAMEWATVMGVTAWGTWRLRDPGALELLTLGFGAAMVIRYVLRKELMHDIRGLRREPRREEFG
jgi:dolichol-phosphate mannosyltransferase